MNIETSPEIVEQLADWLGIYGCCKSDGEDGCEFKKEKPHCCRFGFTYEMEERIREAIKNEAELSKTNLTP